MIGGRAQPPGVGTKKQKREGLGLSPFMVPIPYGTHRHTLPLSPQLQQKAVASEIFKGKKDNYPQSVPRLFISTRLGESLIFQLSNIPSTSCSPLNLV
jgi:hypothetical protein